MLKKINEVFTRKYRNQVECIEFMRRHLDRFKMNNEGEDIEIMIGRLKNKSFVSNFSIKAGNY